MKVNSTFKNKQKLMKGSGILKSSKKNLSIYTNVEINPKNEDIDFLSKFKESKQK